MIQFHIANTDFIATLRQRPVCKILKSEDIISLVLDIISLVFYLD